MADENTDTGSVLTDDAPPPGGTILTQDDATPNASPDAKPDDAKAAEAEPAGAPETYEAFEMPENFSMDEETLTAFQTAAKEANLPQDKAQAFVGMGVKIAEKIQAQYTEALAEQNKQRIELLEHDATVGLDNLGTTKALAAKAINRFGNQAFRDMLDETGAGNTVEMAKFLRQLGTLVMEDNVETDKDDPGNRSTPKTPAEILYGNTPGGNVH